MSYNTVQIIRDVSGNPVPQYYNTTTGQFEALQGKNGASEVGIDQTTPGSTNGVQVNAALPAGANIMGKVGIDQTTPGVTNGIVPVGGSLGVGAECVCTASGVAIGASQACNEVILQADPGNTVNIAVGGSGAQPMILTPGSTLTLRVSNINQVYAKYVTAGTANLNYQPVL